MSEAFRGGRADRCSVRRDGRVLRLAGDIDEANWADVASRVISGLLSGGVELDLTEMRFIGAAGIRTLLTCNSVVGPGIRVTCGPPVFRMLRISGLGESGPMLVTRVPPEGGPR